MRIEFSGFWPEHWLFEHIVRHGIAEIITNQEVMMAALDAAQQNLATLATDVTALLAKSGGVPEADVQAIADAIAALDQTVKNALGA